MPQSPKRRTTQNFPAVQAPTLESGVNPSYGGTAKPTDTAHLAVDKRQREINQRYIAVSRELARVASAMVTMGVPLPIVPSPDVRVTHLRDSEIKQDDIVALKVGPKFYRVKIAETAVTNVTHTILYICSREDTPGKTFTARKCKLIFVVGRVNVAATSIVDPSEKDDDEDE